MKGIKYIDITEDMINEKCDKPLESRYVCEYIKVCSDGNIIKYDESNAKFDMRRVNSDELKTINTLREKLGWNILILHRINMDRVSTPDIKRLQDNEYYDIKNIYGSESKNSRKEKLLHRVSKQCNNFVFDITNKECDLSNQEAIEQIIHIYNKEVFKHVKIIVLIGKKDYIKVYKRK